MTIKNPCCDDGEEIEGEILSPGTELQESDVYASTSGGWEKFSLPPGVKVLDNDVLWVRPAQAPASATNL